mgnify:CR=1 FL=1
MSEEQNASAGASTNQAAATTNTSETPKGWTEGFDTDLKGYVEKKGFKNHVELADSYRNLEKLVGQKEKVVLLPDKFDSPEAKDFWYKAGMPKEAKEYTIEVPKELGDEKLADWAKETAHKLNMPRSMAEGFMKAFGERSLSEYNTLQDNAKTLAKSDHDALIKDWGAAYDQNKNIAEYAAKNFGFGEDELKSLGATLGPAKAMKFLLKLGTGMSEDTFITGNKAQNSMLTPEQAQYQIKELMKDTDFLRRRAEGDVNAKTKWANLNKFAYPGEITI